MHWKLRRDPYFSLLGRRHGEAAAFAAGFFLDEDPQDAPLDDVDWLCTPLPKLSVTGARPAVLVATGGFCPVHAGHLAMMEHARDAAERAGFSVLGGYLSPGHDAYVRAKCGDAAIPDHERLRLCAAAVAGNPWLSVDPWEAKHRRVAVNFTDVTARLSAYLRAHVDPRIEVLYVCGGDNARFAWAFAERGACVVVGRTGADSEFDRWRRQLGDLSNILWVPASSTASSSQLRAPTWPGAATPRIVVRTEDARALRTLGLTAFASFQAELLALLAAHARVRTVPLGQGGGEAGVISLDGMRPAAHNLAVSRLFAASGYELRGHIARPGAPSLAQQVAAIPTGRYLLRDDDSMTGATLAAVRALLPPRVAVTGTRVAVEHAADEDVVDARDFLLGADHGGLVVELPRGIARAPYLLPYVDPAARASIHASHAFSIAVWSLNARLFAAANPGLCVRDLPAAARIALPFPDDQRLDAVCRWHADRLRQIAPLP
jgi:nicotinic acid mononucleotide adenylyltransferase